MLAKFKEFQKKASIYYAYHTIQRYTDEPFTSYMPEALFNISRYLMHELLNDSAVPKGVSRFAVLYALAKQSRNLGAYKLARHVLEKIQGLVVPKRFKENVDLATLMIRAKPFYDNEELLSMCYRCSTTNPLHNARGGNRCNNCGQPFVHSFVSFEILPLVEFHLEEDITDKEAMMLIESSAKTSSVKPKGEDILTMDDSMGANDDPFGQKLFSFQQEGDAYEPVIVNKSALQNMQPGEVIVAKWSPPLRYQYYRNLLPDMSITKCETCNKMFHTDDHELQLLQKGYCPFCRAPSHFMANGNASSSDANDALALA
jgi:intraflagellar transport protein 122